MPSSAPSEDGRPEHATSGLTASDARAQARAAAYLFGAGGVLVLVSLLLPSFAPRSTLGLIANASIALGAAGMLLGVGERLPQWTYRVLVACGTVLITSGVHWAGDATSAFAMFYIWVGVYAFSFFRPWEAALQVALAAAGYGALLALNGGTDAPVARWLVTMGTVVVAGTLIARLVRLSRDRAGEAARRADRLHDAEARTRLILETAQEAFVAMDAAGRVIGFNPEAERTLGWRAREIMGRQVSTTLIPPRMREGFDHELARFLATGESSVVGRRLELSALHREGAEFPVELTVAPARDGDSWVFNAFVHDISERKQAEQKVREQAEDMAMVAQIARELAGLTDPHAARPTICRAAAEVGAAKMAVLLEPDPRGRELVSTASVGMPPGTIRLPFAGEPSGAVVAFSTGEPFFAAHAEGHPSVSQRLVEVFGVTSLYWQPVISNGVTIGVLTLAWDEPVEEIPARVASMVRLLAAEAAVAIDRTDLLARLEAVARTDELTGLANRRAWEEELPRELARAERDRKPLCVAMLDLDRFKEYNDEQGHQAGDRLLKEITAIWREILRPTDIIARYGGEEFIVALPNCPLDLGLEVSERLRVQTPPGQTCSAGVACWDGSETPEELINRADSALYQAKKEGRDRVVAAA